MDYSLFVGRFQIVTIQHKSIIDAELLQNNNIIIQIICGEKTFNNKDKNPFTYEDRYEMFENIYPNEIKSEKIKILKFGNQFLPQMIYDIEAEYPNISINRFICGQDRVDGYKKQFDRIKNNNDLGTQIHTSNILHNYFKEENKDIKFVLYDRDYSLDSDDTSQSKQRQYIKNRDYVNQKLIIPKQLYKNLDIYYDKLMLSESFYIYSKIYNSVLESINGEKSIIVESENLVQQYDINLNIETLTNQINSKLETEDDYQLKQLKVIPIKSNQIIQNQNISKYSLSFNSIDTNVRDKVLQIQQYVLKDKFNQNFIIDKIRRTIKIENGSKKMIIKSSGKKASAQQNTTITEFQQILGIILYFKYRNKFSFSIQDCIYNFIKKEYTTNLSNLQLIINQLYDIQKNKNGEYDIKDENVRDIIRILQPYYMCSDFDQENLDIYSDTSIFTLLNITYTSVLFQKEVLYDKFKNRINNTQYLNNVSFIFNEKIKFQKFIIDQDYIYEKDGIVTNTQQQNNINDNFGIKDTTQDVIILISNKDIDNFKQIIDDIYSKETINLIDEEFQYVTLNNNQIVFLIPISLKKSDGGQFYGKITKTLMNIINKDAYRKEILNKMIKDVQPDVSNINQIQNIEKEKNIKILHNIINYTNEELNILENIISNQNGRIQFNVNNSSIVNLDVLILNPQLQAERYIKENNIQYIYKLINNYQQINTINGLLSMYNFKDKDDVKKQLIIFQKLNDAGKMGNISFSMYKLYGYSQQSDKYYQLLKSEDYNNLIYDKYIDEIISSNTPIVDISLTLDNIENVTELKNLILKLKMFKYEIKNKSGTRLCVDKWYKIQLRTNSSTIFSFTQETLKDLSKNFN